MSHVTMSHESWFTWLRVMLHIDIHQSGSFRHASVLLSVVACMSMNHVTHCNGSCYITILHACVSLSHELWHTYS